MVFRNWKAESKNQVMSDKDREVYEWLKHVDESFVKDVRGDDYHKWSDEYADYFYDCLKKIKPSIVEEIEGSIVDPRFGNGVRDILIQYLYHVW